MGVGAGGCGSVRQELPGDSVLGPEKKLKANPESEDSYARGLL